MPDSQPMLAYSLVTTATPSSHRLFVLHGIYGRGRNWGAIARHLVVRRPEWSSVLIDLRLHGDSPAFAPPHTVEAAAGDVLALEEHVALSPRGVLGHSFGGKVALSFAARSDLRPLQVWVIDSTPEARPPDGAAWRVLRVLGDLPGEFESRQQAIEMMQAQGVAPAVGAWMTMNLGFADGRYRWRLDLKAVEDMLADFFRLDLWDAVEAPAPGVEIEFVKGNDSSTLSEEACARIEAAGRATGRVHLHRVAGGHWLNTDNPEAVLALLQRRLPRR